MFLAFRDKRDLTPAAWEPLAQLSARVMEPRPGWSTVRPGADTTLWQEVKEWVTSQDDLSGVAPRLERNFVICGFPDFWRRENWREALDRFRADLTLFGIHEGEVEL